jgi:hypothetical protein
MPPKPKKARPTKDAWTKASVDLQELARGGATPQKLAQARERMEAAQRDYWAHAKELARAFVAGTVTPEEVEAAGVPLFDLVEAQRMIRQDYEPPMADPEDEEQTDADG